MMEQNDNLSNYDKVIRDMEKEISGNGSGSTDPEISVRGR